jgi:hypothetical protein
MTFATSADYIRRAAGHLRDPGQRTIRIVCIGNVPEFRQNRGNRDANMVFPAMLKRTLSEIFKYGSLLSFDGSTYLSLQVKLSGATVRAQRQNDRVVHYSIGSHTTIAQAAGRGNDDVWTISGSQGIIRPRTGTNKYNIVGNLTLIPTQGMQTD